MSQSAIGIYDRDGHRIDVDEFARLCADPDYRFLARERIGDWEVVTAWLGVDQRPDPTPDQPPLIYGTAGIRHQATDNAEDDTDADADQTLELFEGREHWTPTAAAALARHAEIRDRLQRGVDSNREDRGRG